MLLSTLLKRSLFILGLFFILPTGGYALKPMIQYMDLVAGITGKGGYQDGSFSSAQFNAPLGLSLSEDASLLYIADQGNNRIRAIHLDKKNAVETLAGTGKAGNLDGPLSIAQFNQPSGVAVLPDGQIAINDTGNQSIRLIDLKTKEVSTLAGGTTILSPGDPTKTGFSPVWNLVYFPLDKGLYFSQPGEGTLGRLDLKTHQIVKVLSNSPTLPHPGALCVLNDKLYVADSTLTQIFIFHPASTATPGPGTGAPSSGRLESGGYAGQGYGILSLVGSQNSLYACQTDPQAPIYRVFPKTAPLTFASVWGFKLSYPSADSIPQFKFSPNDRIGLVPDPHYPSRFYITNPHCSTVTAFRDSNFSDACLNLGEHVANSGGLHDLDYPLAKPPRTFRILLIGRSYVFWHANERQFQQAGFEGHDFEDQNLLTSLAKDMELQLNTRAALEDGAFHYEVLNGGLHYLNNEFNVWAYYFAPEYVRKYDIDLVVLVRDTGISVDSFLEYPLTEEGIPSNHFDPEFALKPPLEKFKTGPMRDFYEILTSNHLLTPPPWTFTMNKVIQDPAGEKALIGLMGKPLTLLQDKLASIKTSGGEPCHLVFCYLPIEIQQLLAHIELGQSEICRTFWKDLCGKEKIPFIDVSDPLRALGTTYYPYSGPPDGHFTQNGMTLFSTILLHELLTHKFVPFETDK